MDKKAQEPISIIDRELDRRVDERGILIFNLRSLVGDTLGAHPDWKLADFKKYADTYLEGDELERTTKGLALVKELPDGTSLENVLALLQGMSTAYDYAAQSASEALGRKS